MIEENNLLDGELFIRLPTGELSGFRIPCLTYLLLLKEDRIFFLSKSESLSLYSKRYPDLDSFRSYLKDLDTQGFLPSQFNNPLLVHLKGLSPILDSRLPNLSFN